MTRARSDASPRRAGRPRAAVLSRDRIVAAALDLIDDVGADEFSLGLLAERMSVRPSSFYNHTSGKDDIMAGVQERITDEIDASMFDSLPWREAVIAWAWAYRAAFVAHPHAIALFATAPVLGAARTLDMYERVVAGFERAGWPADSIIPVLVAIESFVLGSALDAVAPPTQLAVGPDAERVPRFAAAVAARDRRVRRRRGGAADLAFETGLLAMVDGLQARLRGP